MAAHARCAWVGATQTPKINVKNNVKMTLGITSAQHVDLYETVDSSKEGYLAETCFAVKIMEWTI